MAAYPRPSDNLTARSRLNYVEEHASLRAFKTRRISINHCGNGQAGILENSTVQNAEILSATITMITLLILSFRYRTTGAIGANRRTVPPQFFKVGVTLFRSAETATYGIHTTHLLILSNLLLISLTVSIIPFIVASKRSPSTMFFNSVSTLFANVFKSTSANFLFCSNNVMGTLD